MLSALTVVKLALLPIIALKDPRDPTVNPLIDAPPTVRAKIAPELNASELPETVLEAKFVIVAAVDVKVAEV